MNEVETNIIDVQAAFRAVRIYNSLPDEFKEGDYKGRLLAFLTGGIITKTGLDLEFAEQEDVIPLSAASRKVLGNVKVKFNNQKTV